MPKNTKKKTDVNQMVTDLLIAKLESGVAPWNKPWTSNGGGILMPRSLKSKKMYRGVNVFLLGMSGYESPWWCTYKQAKEFGGNVRKGEKSSLCVFWNWFETEDKATGLKKRIPFLKKYNVFNVEQCEGLEDIVAKRDAEFGINQEPVDPKAAEFAAIEAAELIAENMPKRPETRHGGDRACYSPSGDWVKMPKHEQFNSPAEYYSTLFHEYAHSTGHSSRVGRDLDAGGFGTDKYGKEELIAEMTAAMLCGHAGIINETIDNSAAYLASWIKSLKGDPKLAVSAAGAAAKAADYILGVAWDKDGNQTKVDETSPELVAA